MALLEETIHVIVIIICVHIKIVLDTYNFKDDWKYGVEVITHEYVHILNYFLSDIFFKKRLTFNAREYMISSLADGTKINNKTYQKFLKKLLDVELWLLKLIVIFVEIVIHWITIFI